MATPTMVHRVAPPGGRTHLPISAQLRLITRSDGRDAHGFVTAGGYSIAGRWGVTVANDGTITMEALNPTSGDSDDVIDVPTGCAYELVVRVDRWVQEPIYFTVPDSSGTHQVSAHLTDAPSNLVGNSFVETGDLTAFETLPASSAPDADDVLLIVEDGAAKRVTTKQLQEVAAAADIIVRSVTVDTVAGAIELTDIDSVPSITLRINGEANGYVGIGRISGAAGIGAGAGGASAADVFLLREAAKTWQAVCDAFHINTTAGAIELTDIDSVPSITLRINGEANGYVGIGRISGAAGIGAGAGGASAADVFLLREAAKTWQAVCDAFHINTTAGSLKLFDNAGTPIIAAYSGADTQPFVAIGKVLGTAAILAGPGGSTAQDTYLFRKQAGVWSLGNVCKITESAAPVDAGDLIPLGWVPLPQRMTADVDFTGASAATPGTLTGLSWAGGANEVWEISGSVFVSATDDTTDAAIGLSTPAGCAGTVSFRGLNTGATAKTGHVNEVLDIAGGTQTVSVGARSTKSEISFSGIVRLSSTAGTVALVGAQATLDAAKTTSFRIDSVLRRRRIA